VNRCFVFASANFDANLSYVAMSRHKMDVRLAAYQPLTAGWLERVLFGCEGMPRLFEHALAENDATWRVVLRGTLRASRADQRADQIAKVAKQAEESPHLVISTGPSAKFAEYFLSDV
jgi:hypothetical protein